MNSDHKQAKSHTKFRAIIGLLLIALVLVAYFGFQFYRVYFSPNVSGEEEYLYVPTGSNIDDLYKDLERNEALLNLSTFKEAAGKMDLAQALKPGRYKLAKGANNRIIINKLKAGNQDPVMLKIQGFRKKENLAGALSRKLEPDSAAFLQLLDSAALIEKYGFNKDNSYAMFIPNTYEMYWNTSATEFFERMHKEYEKFWNNERKQKAAALNLTPIEVSILASIVDAEALYDKEMPIIAGLYLNRLNKGILLQADPTVIFASDDFTVKRVTNALLKVESRYNTYRYAGLPPGPIMMPSIAAIDAVLNKDDNNYIYMCAKEDFSGYHNFAVTVQEHERNARKYREALNKRNIYK
ncbi:endolytic transglycosylase MltG [Pedobacter deserti]|uniref:endolytic transglycosylase MltG n=1 Tax=Pedobacter deserti TaxID=2817382 RepID=UPI00210E4872|nr:endolytic transglycosylase MltG [Pedobacter sp. SYSU D00382]